MTILTIDIGGSSVKSAIYTDKLEDRNHFFSPPSLNEMQVKLDQLISYYLEQYPIEAIAFSVPGIPNHDTGRVEGVSSLRYIHQFDFISYFSEKYQRPIYFENDANCACKAEVQLGIAGEVKNALFMVIGTGIGGTIISNGQILSGEHAYGGEFGMMLIDGRHELSELGSAVHMARKYSILKGKSYTGEEVFALADQGEIDAVAATEKLYHYLALGIYNLQYMIDPEYIVLGGGITKRRNLLKHILRKLDEIMNYGQVCPITPKIRLAKFGNDANLIGAALTVKSSK
ncbi:ROK family protein [Enterococcus saccharolyticus]|uniref:ROK family protein n=1 Tax=Enterococcus TaxID=1350 RepID=UPI001E38EBF4|nr:ROK family protein [Enterococcus saccharolyticus]MCD5001909.1 ROK family protein [Enterococcus saccharolyticus]